LNQHGMETQKYNRVAVLMGGCSSERGISLQSGDAVAAGLTEAGYTVDRLVLDGPLESVPEGIEAVFIALHGVYGEDGGVQKKLEELGIPYTGSGPAASRRAFDKILTRAALQTAGIPIPEGTVLRPEANPEEQARQLGFPLVLKPPREGSSIGVHILQNAESLPSVLTELFAVSDDVLAERFIAGRELTVGIVDGRPLPPVEIRAAGGVYDFDAKYISGTTEYQVPAELDNTTTLRAQNYALSVYHTLGCRGLGRVDLRLQADGALFVLELNSIPGFTPTSLLPKAARADGIPFSELCDSIMQTAQLEGTPACE